MVKDYGTLDGGLSEGHDAAFPAHRVKFISRLAIVVLAMAAVTIAVQPHDDERNASPLQDESGSTPGTDATHATMTSKGSSALQVVKASESTPSSTTTAGELQTSNEWERRTARPIGDGKYPFKVVNAHYPTRLGVSAGLEVYWSIPGVEIDSTVAQSEVEVVFPGIGEYTISVHRDAITPDAEPLATFTVQSRLVRRELRQLNEDERERYFAALRHVYMVGQEEGEKLYGSQFKSAAWLVREHLYGAARQDCDHWHDDAGILNHHVGITWQLEQSLYAIDNTVAAHYWDYTIDASNSSNWYDSDIFKDEWFGTINTDNSVNHAVTTGRWAYTPVMKNARGWSNITNPYGLLRSPWNTDPTPYLMRSRYTFGTLGDLYTSYPACDEFQSFLYSGQLAKMFFGLNGALHGPIHIMTGGYWGYNTTKMNKWIHHYFNSSTASNPDMLLLTAKYLWRQGFTRCPETCSDETPSSDCKCSCPSEIIGNRTADEILNISGVYSLNSFANLNKVYEYGLSSDDLLELLCEVGHAGEMFTSAAPQDPIFWPLHGMAEKFIQYARVLKEEGALDFTEDWGYSHQTSLPSDTGVVCDWSEVEAGSLQRPKCSMETCAGHKENDTLPFEDLVSGQKGLLTNKEFYDEILAPSSTYMPYAYDSLSYWKGCSGGKITYD